MSIEHPGTTRRERSDAAANRERILAAARRLFAEHGVAATSLNMIARAAHVGPGTLYRRFAHKGELCQALLADDLAALEQRITEIVEGSLAPASALDRLDGVLEALLYMIEGHTPLLAAVQEGAWNAPPVSLYQTPFYRRLAGRIEGLLAAGVEQGEIGPLDIEWTTDAMLTTITPHVIMYQQAERGFSHERILAGLRQLFVDGLRA